MQIMIVYSLFCILFRVAIATSVLLFPIAHEGMKLVDNQTASSDNPSIGIYAEWNTTSNDLQKYSNILESIQIKFKQNPSGVPFYESVLSKLDVEELPYAPSSCALYITLSRNIADNNERLALLDSILETLGEFKPYFSVECYPRSARQLAKISNCANQFMFSTVLKENQNVIPLPVEESYLDFIRVNYTNIYTTVGKLLKTPEAIWKQTIKYERKESSYVKLVRSIVQSTISMAEYNQTSQNKQSDILLSVASVKNDLIEISSIHDMDLVSSNIKSISQEKVTIKERSIHKLGLHRELKTSLEIQDNCQKQRNVHVYEHFPTGVYVDIYELKELRRVTLLSMNGVNTFQTHIYNEKVSVETSSLFSAPVYARFTTPLIKSTNGWKAELNVPIHFRYQEPSFDEFRNVSVYGPQFILVDSCTDVYTTGFSFDQFFYDISRGTDMTITHDHSKLFAQTGVNTMEVQFVNDSQKLLIVSIPVGVLRDQMFVTNFTLSITVFSAVLLSAIVCFSKSKIKID